MLKQIDIRLRPEDANDDARMRSAAAKAAGMKVNEIKDFRIERRSIDARSRDVVVQIRMTVSDKMIVTEGGGYLSQLKNVGDADSVAIIGAGPAGYFAALELIELGLKPIIFERGKDVRTRRRDLKAIQQDGVVNPHSNYCFGEGGAGTYSDGKLYTRSHKRGNIQKILQFLVEHGAHPDILIDAHPHIGSNKLPGVVSAIRETIEKHGGEIHFDSHITDFQIENDKITGLICNGDTLFLTEDIILATGHSARDIYHLLHDKGLSIEFKPFALGVRIEHPQALIDEIQYRQSPRSPHLPASSYGLACQIGGAGVFSFCMCPGGLIVPTATAPGEIVVNGMSLSKRDSPFANAGTVTTIEASDIEASESIHPLKGLEFQSEVEQFMFRAGSGGQQAPAQRLTDFLDTRISDDLPDSSYIPGLFSAPVNALLPHFVFERLHDGILQFERKMRGYLTSEAVVVGTESRTSSPVRIPRDDHTLMHPQVKGLFPCGEGAGYAGGIVSAAMDGQRIAQAVAIHKNS